MGKKQAGKVKVTVVLTPSEKAALVKRARSESLSVAALIRRFALGLVSIVMLACGGESSSVSADPNGSAGKHDSGSAGSVAGRSHQAGTGGSGSGGDSGSAGEAPAATGGSGSKPSGAGGSAGKPANVSGSAGEADAGEPSAVGGSVGDGGEPGAGGANEAGAGGEPSGTGGTGVAGSGPVECAELSNETCGGTSVNHLVRHEPKDDTYCIKVNFLGPGRAWFDKRDDECSLGEPDRVMTEQECFVVWGPAYGAADIFWVDRLYTQQDKGDACVNRISKQTYDSNPGNFFCSCP
jgi:hypothetical protein